MAPCSVGGSREMLRFARFGSGEPGKGEHGFRAVIIRIPHDMENSVARSGSGVRFSRLPPLPDNESREIIARMPVASAYDRRRGSSLFAARPENRNPVGGLGFTPSASRSRRGVRKPPRPDRGAFSLGGFRVRSAPAPSPSPSTRRGARRRPRKRFRHRNLSRTPRL